MNSRMCLRCCTMAIFLLPSINFLVKGTAVWEGSNFKRQNVPSENADTCVRNDENKLRNMMPRGHLFNLAMDVP